MTATSRSEDPATCILVPTVGRYLPAARLTVRLIDEYWPHHPPVYFCGVDLPDSNALPCSGNPSSWMSIVRDAVTRLRELGYARTYLILDDQGPMGPCHARHLNQTIPRWMTELDAVYVSIRGWDHRRNSMGAHLGGDYAYLQRQSPRYAWRFALHPALWRLEVLGGILDLLMGPAGCAGRSPWDFEREAGLLGDRLPSAWNESTYRVCGREMAVTPAPYALRKLRHFRDGIARRLQMLADGPIFRGHRWSAAFSSVTARALRSEAVFYDGPYPMHFSGFLVKGKVNTHLRRRLERSGQAALLKAISSTEVA